MFPSITERKLRIAIVGCGRIAKNHFGSIEKHADKLELVAVCDINSTHSTPYASQYDVPAYHDMADMLSKHKPDLVALCTPSGIHADQAALAAKHGVHVITEKPMATRWSDGVRMVKACDEAGYVCLSSSKTAATRHCNCSSGQLKRSVSAKSTWFTSTYSGHVHKPIMTKPNGAAHGNLTVVRS